VRSNQLILLKESSREDRSSKCNGRRQPSAVELMKKYLIAISGEKYKVAYCFPVLQREEDQGNYGQLSRT
jgi:hypothetical protein